MPPSHPQFFHTAMMASSPSASPPPPPPLPVALPPPPSLSQSRSRSPSLSPTPKPNPLLLTAPESKPLSPPKKSPPLPWTHQETLALIEAYQEKWYSLKKGQLKAFQWEEVSAVVAARCGYGEPSKTSTQCRHKIEKLRKRYRSELQKPYPNLWQYFDLMDRMERGPMALTARPIAAVKSSPINVNNSSNSINHGYGSMYSGSADYYSINSRGDGGESDESDEDWNAAGYGVQPHAKNKSKSINNILKGRTRSAKRVGMDMGFSHDRVIRALRSPINGKRKQYFDGDDSDDYVDDADDVAEDRGMQVEEKGEEGYGGMELAAAIRGFSERFMGMEKKKIEMMRETETFRMEMEKKRMDIILEGQRKIVDTIGRAFGVHKKANMAQET